jgi:uncharacterized membrane protein YdjX (TVP38/TMEM64 family)
MSEKGQTDTTDGAAPRQDEPARDGARVGDGPREPWLREYRWLVNLGVFLLVAAVGVLISHFTTLREHVSMESIGEAADQVGAWGPAIVLVAGAFTPLLFLPRWPVAFFCGMAYGVVAGSMLANAACVLGAWVQYLVARYLLGPVAERVRRKSALGRFKVAPDRQFAILFFFRAFPVSNSVATNLLAGSLHMRQPTYLVASFLGMIPSTIMYASWGKLLKRPSPQSYALAVGLVIVMGVGTFVARRRLARWLNSPAGTASHPPSRSGQTDD